MAFTDNLRGAGGFEAQLGRIPAQITRLFDELSQSVPAALRPRFAPALEVREDTAGIVVTADLPGMAQDQVTIELEDAVLTLKGERAAATEREDAKLHVQERSFGAFSRSVTLPFAPVHDTVAARFENGVLTITLPRPAQARPAARRVDISGSAQA